MSGSVQRVVDRIASELHRPALLEDQFERLIAYSTHQDPLDEVRNHTILYRRAAPQVVDWLNLRGLRAARSPLRVPGNSDLGMLPRICFPIREQGQLLGYLWFVESENRMSAQDTLRATHAAAELRAVLSRENATADPTSDRVVSALRRLLLGGRERETAARQLRDDGYVQVGDRIVVVVVKPFCGGRGDQAAVEHAVSCVLEGVWQTVPPSRALQLRQSDHGVLLLAAADNDSHALDARLSAIGDAGRTAVAQAGGIMRVLIGVGGTRSDLVEAADSYQEARLSARAGIVLPPTDDYAVHWTQLGIYQLVAQLAEESEPPRVIHAGLRAVIADPEAVPLLETLETYLDVAGNAQVAAQLLNLHRGSLYYRLQRVERLAGTSLRDGMERLSLHLELKLARLTGDYLPRQTAVKPDGQLGRVPANRAVS